VVQSLRSWENFLSFRPLISQTTSSEGRFLPLWAPEKPPIPVSVQELGVDILT